jgi:hypothetical protein
VTLNVLLARKINALRQVEANLKAVGNLQPGETVSALEAKTLDGQSVSFPYGASELPIVIYVLSPACKWCEKNQRSVEMLANSTSNKYRFVALSLTSNNLKQYLEEKNVSFPVYTELPLTTYSTYKLGNGTPQTIVVSSEGKVLKNWQGAYSDDLKREVEEYFNIELPGIAPS